MRTLAILALSAVMCAMSASAEIVPSGHNMMWEDYYEDWHDNYVEVERGDSFGLSIMVNSTGGYGNGGITNVSWDSAVMNVTEDTSNTYWRQYYTLQFEWYGVGVFETQWYESYWDQNLYGIQEGQYVNRVWVTIAPDAPVGISLLGLTQTMLRHGGAETNAVIPRDGTDPFAMRINVLPPPLGIPGDFDGDGDVDADDIDILCANMGGDPATYDVDEDGDVDEDDMIVLIETLVELTDGVRVGTKRGDFNLDGFVDGTDLALMKTAFGQPSMTYADGNANCDAFVDGTDLAILKTNFGFIADPAGGVPEPATLSLLALGGMALLRRRSR
ncbi:MAG TPA: PEP-CTERM sorting domain-containing protein [Phycisphaerae bacterium]|nr:PEP-CTERM sorting domain-containing protein [Phycisphaerae bacterium]HDZ44032.1 PEP-CTERM sorting domain-containing protein [Phycisphaerae bacterium]